MNLIQDLLGGQQQQQDYQGFVNRYQQGQPWEGYSGEEAMNRYQQLATQLPPNAYQQAAQQTFSQMSPEQRMQFGQLLQQQAQQQGYGLPGMGGGQMPQLQEPTQLAQMTTQMHQQQPGMLAQLLGGGGGNSGGMLSNPLAKMALAGITAMAAKQLLGKI